MSPTEQSRAFQVYARNLDAFYERLEKVDTGTVYTLSDDRRVEDEPASPLRCLEGHEDSQDELPLVTVLVWVTQHSSRKDVHGLHLCASE